MSIFGSTLLSRFVVYQQILEKELVSCLLSNKSQPFNFQAGNALVLALGNAGEDMLKIGSVFFYKKKKKKVKESIFSHSPLDPKVKTKSQLYAD